MSEVQKYLDEFKRSIISEAKRNLRKQKTTGDLSKSLKSRVKESPNSIEITFRMKAYGFFQDRGVKGTEKGKSLSNFKYKTGKENAPPPRVFSQWAIKKLPKQTRDSKGRFVSRKSLQFALSRHIQKNGIEPTLFFTKPFEKHFKKLPEEIIEKYKLDIEKLFNQIEGTNLKDKK